MCSDWRSRYSAADWAQNFVRIDSGEVDAFISNVTVTEERKEKYDFATYRLDTLALETQKDSDWTVSGPEGSGRQDHRRRLRHQPGEDPGRLERRQRRRGPGADRHQVLPELHRLLPGALLGSDRRLLRAEPDRAVPRRQHRRDQGHRHLLRCRRRPAGRDRRADQEGQRPGQGVRRRHQPHHRERHLPAGARPLEPGQRGGRVSPRSIRRDCRRPPADRRKRRRALRPSTVNGESNHVPKEQGRKPMAHTTSQDPLPSSAAA